MKQAQIQLSLRDMPEVLAGMRVELAKVLREEAGEETDPRTARRLREIADYFEAGLSRADRRGMR